MVQQRGQVATPLKRTIGRHPLPRDKFYEKCSRCGSPEAWKLIAVAVRNVVSGIRQKVRSVDEMLRNNKASPETVTGAVNDLLMLAK